MGLISRGERENSFLDKVVLITGAASGLGRGLAVAFARAGASLVIVDVNEDGLRETAAKVRNLGSRCLTRRVDVSKRAEMEGLAEEVLSDWGHVDILVNNAGVGIGGEYADIPIDDIEWIVGINLMGVMYGTRLFLPQMIERGKGHIVNISSLSGVSPLPFHSPYTATKFGVAGFSRVLWAEARCRGVDVSLVCPGAMNTNILAESRVSTMAKTQRTKFVLEDFARRLKEGGLAPDEAARRVLRAIKRKQFLLLLGSDSWTIYHLSRLFPNLMLRITGMITRWALKK